jgi:hypothetical protein
MVGAAGRGEDGMQGDIKEVVVIDGIMRERQLDDAAAWNGVGAALLGGDWPSRPWARSISYEPPNKWFDVY